MARLIPELQQYTSTLTNTFDEIPGERKPVIEDMVAYIVSKLKNRDEARLNFICTHNSRRSQFSQIWAQTAAHFYDVPGVKTYSGGVEVTAFNERAVKAIKKAGFTVSKKKNGENPIYFVHFSMNTDPIAAFSKVFDDALNAKSNFAAIMTCSDADENCPFIPGAEARIPLRFEDPKAYDGTDQEVEKYDERCKQIATEMFYAFSRVKELIS